VLLNALLLLTDLNTTGVESGAWFGGVHEFIHFSFVLVSSNDSFSILRHFSVDSPEGGFG
jgi:hypothetical protein